MTNEELGKLIFKQVDKLENKFQMRMIGLLFMEVLGFCLVGVSSEKLDGDVAFMVGFLIGIAFLVFFGIWISQTHKHNKVMRDYIWNLVRADERKRCMTEQYENEGSK
jgi:hypothetical protein